MQVNWPVGPRLPERGPTAMPSLQTNIERRAVPKGKGPPLPRCHDDDRGSGGTLVIPSNEKPSTFKELWVVLDMTGEKISFLIDRGATILS